MYCMRTNTNRHTSMSGVHLKTNTMTCTTLLAFYQLLYVYERIHYESSRTSQQQKIAVHFILVSFHIDTGVSTHF